MPPDRITIDLVTDAAVAPEVADLAAATFPLACPPHADPADVDAFVRTHLAADHFARYIRAAGTDLFVARDADAVAIGYTLVHHGAPDDPAVAAVVTGRPAAEISKVYVLPGHHHREPGSSPAHLLMTAALDTAVRRGDAIAWLGVNEENVRAQRFYRKHGFGKVGARTFDLNSSTEQDDVLARPLGTAD